VVTVLFESIETVVAVGTCPSIVTVPELVGAPVKAALEVPLASTKTTLTGTCATVFLSGLPEITV